MKSVLILIGFAIAINIAIRPKLAYTIYALVMAATHPVILIRYAISRVHDKYVDYKFNRIVRRIAKWN